MAGLDVQAVAMFAPQICLKNKASNSFIKFNAVTRSVINVYVFVATIIAADKK